MITFKRTNNNQVQATHNGQVVAACNLDDSTADHAWSLLALNPTLHRLVNWLLHKNEDRTKQAIIMRGGLLAISGAVELADHQCGNWSIEPLFYQGDLHGRVIGSLKIHIINGRDKRQWHCDCNGNGMAWLFSMYRRPIAGINKTDCCPHEVALWLVRQLLKRKAAHRTASTIKGFHTVVAHTDVICLADEPIIDQVQPYIVWRIPSETIKGVYHPVTYCLVRPLSVGNAGVIVRAINPGWQWRRGIDELLELATTLNTELDN